MTNWIISLDFSIIESIAIISLVISGLVVIASIGLLIYAFKEQEDNGSSNN